jgi:hypothetical protein
MMNLFIKSWNWKLAKKYIVRLTEEERTDLESLIHKGKVAAHKRLHAEILLKAAYSGSKLPPIPDECCHPFHFKAATDSG